MKQYDVYHCVTRDTQVYCGDSSDENIDLYDQDCIKNWIDFSGDILVDVLSADDEFEAVRIVAENTGYHESNLYAVEHVVSISGEMNPPYAKGQFSMEAGRFDDGDLTGIYVTMPDGRVVYVALNKATAQMAVTVSDPEGGKDPQTIDL